ncbi:MAG: YitT family protein [Oscillospiraceae bacterium]|nr:YitT family protein [Oscillospiraceae bacterium]
MKMMNTVRELVVMAAATLIAAAAVFFFLVPSHAAVSSVSGLAIVLSNFIPLSISAITMGLNIVLLIVGFLLFGHDFGFKTVYTSVLLPVFIGMFEVLLPDYTSLTEDAVLDVVCYIFMVSIGLSILFNMNASSGGLDIIAKILNRYLHMDLGKAMSLSGMVVALSSAFVYDKKTVVISVLGTYLNGMVLDHFIFGQRIKRRVCIISKNKEEQIRDWILHTLKSGATIYQAQGTYDGVVRNEIITIVDKNEYQKLMQYMAKEDPEAFLTVYNVSDVRYVPKSGTSKKS